MRVQARVLHGQHPRDVVALVVVRVPPARRSDENSSRNLIASDRIDDKTVLVDLLTHQGVHARFRRDRKI